MPKVQPEDKNQLYFVYSLAYGQRACTLPTNSTTQLRENRPTKYSSAQCVHVMLLFSSQIIIQPSIGQSNITSYARSLIIIEECVFKSSPICGLSI